MEERAGQSETNWPIPEFHFKVEWGSEVFSFQEVLGLDSESIKFRSSDINKSSETKMRSITSFTAVTMKNGIFKGDKEIFNWLDKLKMNTIERVPVTISLLNEGSGAVMIWKLANAWPTKITSTDLLSGSLEIAIEAIEIMHEGLSVSQS